MEWLICGTVADKNYPLAFSTCHLDLGQILSLANYPQLNIQRGTPALIASALIAAKHLNIPAPKVLLVGDEGRGEGSKKLYAQLIKLLPQENFGLITYHYLFPDLDGHNRLLLATQNLEKKPILVADAGFMYVAKMSGYAEYYDLFTPDTGEMAFLADEKAPHPFYTRGFLLSQEDDIPALIKSAQNGHNIAKNLIIKGKKDYIVQDSKIIDIIDSPNVEAMEAIGGTGDLITGLVSALLAAGFTTSEASILAAKSNRVIGQLAQPTPATQVSELLAYIPKALKQILI